MREIRSSGSVRGVRRNPYPYRDPTSSAATAAFGTLALPMLPDGDPRTNKPRTSLFVQGYVPLVNGKRGQKSRMASRTDRED